MVKTFGIILHLFKTHRKYFLRCFVNIYPDWWWKVERLTAPRLSAEWHSPWRPTALSAHMHCQPACHVGQPALLCSCFCCLLYQSGFLEISLSNLLFLNIYVLCWMSLSRVSLYWLLWHQINLTAWASNIHL